METIMAFIASLHFQEHSADVCVVGGGMAGLCAAIASARSGAKTVLIHDRPVLGGNASSEVRMWICGAHGKNNKETGILEEIQLENQFRNPSLSYSVWDSVLYGAAFHQPNLTTLLNASVLDAEWENDTIKSVRAWQGTAQTWQKVTASVFVDGSGDSILAGLVPALVRSGREASSEFGEDIEPPVADNKTMGNTLLIQFRRTSEPQSYTPPRWAYKFTRPEDMPHRISGVQAHNFWWLEIGGLDDTIKDAEAIRDELMKITYGVWDYLKNHADEKESAANWAIEWIGSLPGKRENRRYVGDYTLTQNDIRAGGIFADIIAYGGWSMDDHHPAGLLYPGKPTIFHPAPSPYGIPYRTLYSQNINNLLFAGRNISVTHAALSSTRVMATCAILGQAAGTAAALCVRHDCAPRDLASGERLTKLQQILLDDDCFLPGLARTVSPLARAAAQLCGPENVEALRDGHDRAIGDNPHSCEGPVGEPIEYRWDLPVFVGGVRLTFDSNLANDKRMPYSYPQKGDRCLVPDTLVRRFRIDARTESGNWEAVARMTDNYQRLVRVPVGVSTTALRLVPEATWGSDVVRIFAFEPTEVHQEKLPVVADGAHIREVRARRPASDLAEPANGLEHTVKGHHGA